MAVTVSPPNRTYSPTVIEVTEAGFNPVVIAIRDPDGAFSTIEGTADEGEFQAQYTPNMIGTYEVRCYAAFLPEDPPWPWVLLDNGTTTFSVRS